MQKINELLDKLGIKLYECNGDWRESVENYNEQLSNLSPKEAAKKEDALIKEFFEIHEVEVKDDEVPNKAKTNEPKVVIDFAAYVDEDFMKKVAIAKKRREILLKINS